MRILINTINYKPELTGIGKYSGEMAEWLAEQGFDVRVITAPPYYPAWKVSDGYSSVFYRKEKINGVSVTRCPLWVPEELSGFKRILHLASFAITSFPVMIWTSLSWRPSLVFVIEPPLLCAPTALLSGFICRADTWLHVQDFEIDAAFDLGIIRSPRLKRFMQSAESWIMRKFTRVSTISEQMLLRLSLKHVLSGRQQLFQNWVDLDTIYPIEDSLSLKNELGLPEEAFILLYSGNLGEKQGLEIIIEAAKALNERNDLLFLLCGGGAALGRLIKTSSELKNLRYIPLQPLSRLNELLNMADVHLLPQRSDAEDLVMPSKLSNMMASGKPVVATARVGTQVEEIVRQCGLVVNPGDTAAFVEAIVTLLENSEKRKLLGARGREIACEKWEKNKVLSTAFADYSDAAGK